MRNAITCRRILGTFFLLAALLMLFVGETFLKPSLTRIGFVIYWSTCFLFSICALWTAILDLRAIRHDIRDEQRDLLGNVLKNVEQDAEHTSARKDDGQRG